MSQQFQDTKRQGASSPTLFILYQMSCQGITCPISSASAWWKVTSLSWVVVGSEDGVTPWKDESEQQKNHPHVIAKCLQARPGHCWSWEGRLLTPLITFSLYSICRHIKTTSLLHLGYRFKKNLTISLKQKRQAISKPKMITGELSQTTCSPVLQILGLSPRKGFKGQDRTLLHSKRQESGLAIPSASIRRSTLYLVVVRVVRSRKNFPMACHHW